MHIRRTPAEVARLLSPREFIALCHWLDVTYGERVEAHVQMLDNNTVIKEYSCTVKFHVLDVWRSKDVIGVQLDLGKGRVFPVNIKGLLVGRAA